MTDSDRPGGDVYVERDGGVTVIVMNRPDRKNAVDGPMAAQLRDAFLEFESDESQKVAILWGRGRHILCRCGFDRSLRPPRPRA